jgi:hypothetical protein
MPKPEQNLWNSFKQALPKKSHWNRIENRTGTGAPDVYLVMDGVACWVELKVINKNRVRISQSQIAWHLSHDRCGGLSFFLMRETGSKSALLFPSSDALALCEPRAKWPDPICECVMSEIPASLRAYALAVNEKSQAA